MRGSDKSTINQIIKFGYFHPNQRSRANPGSQSHRDNAVTMRPPSSIPTGVRLNRFKKYPNHASAMKMGAANTSPNRLQINAPKLPSIGPSAFFMRLHPVSSDGALYSSVLSV